MLKRRNFLNLLADSKSEARRKKLIKLASKPDILAISELALNILKGNVPLTGKDLKRLSTIKGQLRKLASRKVEIETKKKVLTSKKVLKGGFLPLIPLALSALGGLLPALIPQR